MATHATSHHCKWTKRSNVHYLFPYLKIVKEIPGPERLWLWKCLRIVEGGGRVRVFVTKRTSIYSQNSRCRAAGKNIQYFFWKINIYSWLPYVMSKSKNIEIVWNRNNVLLIWIICDALDAMRRCDSGSSSFRIRRNYSNMNDNSSFSIWIIVDS